MAALLAIARREVDDELDDEFEEVREYDKNKNDDDIEDLILWKEIKRQVRILREDMDGTSSEGQDDEDTFRAKAIQLEC